MTTSSTRFGTSVYGTDLGPTFDALDPGMIRIYDDEYKLAAVSRRGVPVSFSMQTWDADKAARVLKVLPTRSLLTVKHEPEDEVAAKTLTLATWRSWQLKLVEAIKRSGRVGEVLPATILMAWTLDSHSGRNYTDYLTPDVVAALKSVGGIAGWDCYVGPNQGGDHGPTVSAKDTYGSCVDISTKLGLPWAITETGVRVNPSAVDAQAAWWREVFAYARDKGAYCFLLWNSPSNNPADVGVTFQITGFAPLVEVWRQACAGQPPAPMFSQADVDAAVAAAVAPLAAQLAQEKAHSAALDVALAQADTDLATAQDNAATAAAAAQAATAQALADAATAQQNALDAAQAANVAHLADLSAQVDLRLASAATQIAGILVLTPARRAKVLAVLTALRATGQALLH